MPQPEHKLHNNQHRKGNPFSTLFQPAVTCVAYVRFNKKHRTAELRNGITLHSFTSSGSADSYRPERQAGSCAKMTIGFLAPNPIPHNALVCYCAGCAPHPMAFVVFISNTTTTRWVAIFTWKMLTITCAGLCSSAVYYSVSSSRHSVSRTEAFRPWSTLFLVFHAWSKMCWLGEI